MTDKQRPNETWEEFCRRTDGFADARHPAQPGWFEFEAYVPRKGDAK